jgi:hypothetical protein
MSEACAGSSRRRVEAGFEHMGQVAPHFDAADVDHKRPALCGEAREGLGMALRAVYEGTVETQPIPDVQIDLLLRLRHKERDRQRSAA